MSQCWGSSKHGKSFAPDVEVPSQREDGPERALSAICAEFGGRDTASRREPSDETGVSFLVRGKINLRERLSVRQHRLLAGKTLGAVMQTFALAASRSATE